MTTNDCRQAAFDLFVSVVCDEVQCNSGYRMLKVSQEDNQQSTTAKLRNIGRAWSVVDVSLMQTSNLDGDSGD